MQLKQIYTKITQTFPNYRMRDSQMDMIEDINQCFSHAKPELKDGSNICLIEAPTGTGKSLAYLLSGIVNAQNLAKKLVIATATKTLQSQLVEKDIPALIQYSGVKFSYGLAKGRSNYLCPYQLELTMSGVVGDMFTDVSSNKKVLTEIRQCFASKIWNGDLDLAPIFIDHKLKTSITIDKERCLAYACPYNQKAESNCPFYLNREKLKTCDVIVTNHSLLLADITLGGGVLPVKPQDYLLCVDEGHNFAQNAMNSFSKRVELKHVIDHCQNLAKLIYDSQTQSYFDSDVVLCDELFGLVNNLVTMLNELMLLLKQNLQIFKNNVLILNDYLNPLVGSEFRDRFVNFAYISGELYTGLDKIADKFMEQIKNTSDPLVESALNKLGFYMNVIETMMLISGYIINQDDSRYNANAKWVEYKSVHGHEDFIINAGLTHVGNILYSKLWAKVYGAVITSATLSIGKDFKFYLHKLGLSFLPNVITKKLSTSFEYVRQAQIVVPRFKVSPEFTTRIQFTEELSKYLTKVLNYVDAYGTLVLFFNRNQLQETYDMLPKGMQCYILLQTDYTSSQRLILEHKKNIDNGCSSVIFGLNSFAEGVDLPSIYCIHVIITKLPFETHKDPQSMVQEYWVKYEKGNYFIEVSIPETCIRLIQAAGRLIRDEYDYGQVSICDNRLITKAYGSIFLDALPEFNRKYNSEFINESFAKIMCGVSDGKG